jgi:hypothetical protein
MLLLLLMIDSIPAADNSIFDAAAAAANSRYSFPAAANSIFDATAANSRFNPYCC